LRSLALPVLVLGCDYREIDRTSPSDMPDALGAADDGDEQQSVDQLFLDRMIHQHRGAIGMARVASQRSEHAELEAMAEETVAEQRAELDQMEAWRSAWYGDPTTLPSRTYDEDLAMTIARNDQRVAAQVRALEHANPFDSAFIDAMIPHHQKAVAMSQDAMKNAERDEVRRLASMIVQDRTKEIAAMETWRATWYPTVQAANVRE
jgi:uncharacterized protein (DUF305 family)